MKGVNTLPRQNNMSLFLGAIVAAVILAIVGILYLIGDGPLDPGRQIKHALLFFVLAIAALVIANFNRPLGTTR